LAAALNERLPRSPISTRAAQNPVTTRVATNHAALGALLRPSAGSPTRVNTDRPATITIAAMTSRRVTC